ncbi:facilitated trehalose transporter Tret1-like [Belonocnema kinseyi]|uniref:facilitated trehalose transporter Tret1-like n=1 Tax=Belonocnema kinseyi TaxID=2817044 RepID=UPI00143CD55C|nr:facilitated trehalose transporter Tret1-like [Belonocnema kinseyi]
MQNVNKFDYFKNNNEVPLGSLSLQVDYVPKKVGNSWLQWAATASVCHFPMTVGTTYSWNFPVLPHLKSNNSEIYMTEVEEAWMATSNEIGSFTSNIVFLFITSFLGRSNWFLMITIPYIITWLMIFFAKKINTLCVSRFVIGMVADFVFALVQMYIGEIADKEMRGILLIGIMTFVNSSQMYLKTARIIFSFETMNIMMLIVTIVCFAKFFFVRENTYYHLLQNLREKSLRNMTKIKGANAPKIVDSELERIEHSVKESQENEKWEFQKLFVVKGKRTRLFSVFLAWIAKYLSVSTSIGAFTQDAFKETEIALGPEKCATIIAIIGVTMALLATFIIECAGRGSSFLLSGLFPALCLAILIFVFLKTYLEADVKSITWLPLVGLIVYEIAFSLGLSYVPVILMCKIFALNIKTPAKFFTHTTMTILVIIIKISFQGLNNLSGIYTTFWIYTICIFFGSIFYFYITPEAKGKTLEEIQDSIHAKFRRKFHENERDIKEKILRTNISS